VGMGLFGAYMFLALIVMIILILIIMKSLRNLYTFRDQARQILNGEIKPTLSMLDELIQQQMKRRLEQPHTSSKNLECDRDTLFWTAEDEANLSSLQRLRDNLLANNLR